MEPSTSTSWNWQIVGTDKILTDALNVLNNTSETEKHLSNKNSSYKHVEENELTEQSAHYHYKEPHEGNILIDLQNPPQYEGSVAGLLKQWDVSELEEHFNDLLDPEEDAIIIKEKLKFMQEYEIWDEVKLLWKKCENFRRKFLVEDESKNITNILTEWPSYKHPMGSTLIDLDFENIYPNASNLYTKWDLFKNIVLDLFTSKIKDKHCKAILGKLDDETVSEEGKNVATLFLLHGAIVPTSKKTVKMGTRKVLLKYTITDSQDSFMVTGRSINEVEAKLLGRNNQNHPIQPFLVVIFEDDLINPKQYLVCCDQIKYNFMSIIPALDCCFKIFHVFNLKYPLESIAVWQFIQHLFYEIYSEHDTVIPNCSVFLNDIKKKFN